MANAVSFTSRGKTIPSELYRPSTSTTATTGVIVAVYGTDGLTDNLSGPWATMIRGYADALAAAGFVVLIPDYFQVTGTPPGPAVLASISTSRDTWQGALSDAIAYAMAQSGVDKDRVGLLGFSLGGHLCLRLRGRAKVVIEYFAPVLDGIGTAPKSTHAQIHHGEADELPGTSFSNAGTIKAILEGEGTPTELFGYPDAGHGFGGAQKGDADARDKSKARTLACFAKYL